MTRAPGAHTAVMDGVHMSCTTCVWYSVNCSDKGSRGSHHRRLRLWTVCTFAALACNRRTLNPSPGCFACPPLQLTQGASASSTPEAGNSRASRKWAPASSEPERGFRVRPSWRPRACGQSAGRRGSQGAKWAGRGTGKPEGNRFLQSLLRPSRRNELHSPQQPDWPWR